MSALIVANVIAALGSFCGIMCIAHKKKIGFIIFFVVEICMFYIGYMSSQYGVLAMSIIYLLSNIYSYILWSK